MTLSEAIALRHSTRNYDAANPPSDETLEALEERLTTLPRPFDGEEHACVRLLRPSPGVKPEFGTYGMIRNAEVYLVLSLKEEQSLGARLEGGYVMEHAILEATRLGLDTCWLGGTFKAKDFTAVIGQDEKIVAVSPVGHASNRRHLLERITRRLARATTRRPFHSLFYAGEYGRPYPIDGQLADAFEAVRVAPSASNRQPWRFVSLDDGGLQLFGAPSPLFRDNDLGIAMAHFDISRGKRADWCPAASDEGLRVTGSPYPLFVTAHS